MSIFSPIKKGFSAVGRSLSDKERKIIVILLTLSITGIIWTLVIYVNSHTRLIAAEGGTYKEGVVGQPRYVTPVLAKTNDVDMSLTHLIYSGLMKVTDNGELTGDLAESVEVSPDGKVYTAHLRKNIKWHDGEPFTANDVLFTIQTIQNPDTKSPASPNFLGVTVQKVDDSTIKFNLNTPYAPFLYNLTNGIIPEHVWSQIEPKNISLAEQNLKPIGTGPFEFKKLKKSSLGEVREYDLKKFDNYYGQRPYIDGINFSFYDTNEELVRSFRSRKVDGMSFVPTTLIKDVAKMGGTTVYRVNIPQYFAVFFPQYYLGSFVTLPQTPVMIYSESPPPAPGNPVCQDLFGVDIPAELHDLLKPPGYSVGNIDNHERWFAAHWIHPVPVIRRQYNR